MFERRLLLSSLAAQTLIGIFPKTKIASYKAHEYGFCLFFALDEKLDDTFFKLFRDAFDLLLASVDLYPMTMMAGVVKTYLQHEKQELLAEQFHGKALVDMVKVGARALPAPHVELGRLYYEFFPLTKNEGLWKLEAAVFQDKKELKDFLKLYATKELFDPVTIACHAGLLAESGYWHSSGLDLLESLRKSEENFWVRRGYERVFAGEGGLRHVPSKALMWAPIFDNSLNINMLDSLSPRLWALDQAKKLQFEEAEPLFQILKVPYKREKTGFFIKDPLGALYEATRQVASPEGTRVSLFSSPAQILALLLQVTRGDMRRLDALQKEMFEFSR